MKKIICIALIFCFAMLSFPCYADTSPPHFDVSTTADTMDVGDETYLLVNLNGNEGFGAVQFCITYDKEKMTLESASLGELIPGSAISSINTDITGEINFSVISVQDIVGDGTVLVAKFKAKDAGTAEFDFKLLAYADSNGISLDATGNDAAVTIGAVETTATEEPEVTTAKPSKPKPKPSDSEKEPETTTVTEKTEETEPPEEPNPVSFADVDTSHWAYSQIGKAAAMGLFSGTGDGMFSPDLPMTRAMFVTVLHRYAGSPTAKRADFADIEDSWYTDAVSWAAQNGIVSGTGDNKFSPNDYITRGQIATILYRYKNGKTADINLLNAFSDANSIPDWGRDPIAWAVEQGLVMGRDGGLVAFADNATRAEAAVIFVRFLNVK